MQEYRQRPSLAGPERCIRQMVYMASGHKPKALPGRAVVVLDDSSWHEELTLNWLRKPNSGFTVHSEQMPIEVDGMKGSIDAIITDIIGVDRLLEHKALSHFGFEELLKGHLPFDYFTQMALYIKALQKSNPELTEGILFVKNKNQSAYLDYVVKYYSIVDELHVVTMTHHSGRIIDINKIIQNITIDAKAKFAKVEQYVQEHTLPARQYTIDTWRCAYCGYRDICWQGWANEHERLETGVELEAEIADMIRYRQEAQAHETEMKKEKEELTEKIKKYLAGKGIRSGRAGEYVVQWTVKIVREFNKELLPVGVYEAAKEELPQERFSIKKIKGEQNETFYEH